MDPQDKHASLPNLIGQVEPSDEKFAATLMRSFCADTGIAVRDSFHITGPTFWHVRGSNTRGGCSTGTKIDHILGPADLRAYVINMNVAAASGRRLQLADRVSPWDHWPMLAKMYIVTAAERAATRAGGQSLWDRDALRSCLHGGVARQELLDALDQEFEKPKTELEDALFKSPSADNLDTIFIDTVKRAALPTLGVRYGPAEKRAPYLGGGIS